MKQKLIHSALMGVLIWSTASMAATQKSKAKIEAKAPQTVTQEAQQRGALNKDEIKNLVQLAANYIKEHGEEQALTEFNNPNSQFVKDNTYVFAVNFEGVTLANPVFPNVVGKNHFDEKDVKGRSLFRALVERAKLGGGWVSYYWKNPKTNKEECKSSFVVPYEKKMLIGAGIYHDPNTKGECADI